MPIKIKSKGKYKKVKKLLKSGAFNKTELKKLIRDIKTNIKININSNNKKPPHKRNNLREKTLMRQQPNIVISTPSITNIPPNQPYNIQQITHPSNIRQITQSEGQKSGLKEETIKKIQESNNKQLLIDNYISELNRARKEEFNELRQMHNEELQQYKPRLKEELITVIHEQNKRNGELMEDYLREQENINNLHREELNRINKHTNKLLHENMHFNNSLQNEKLLKNEVDNTKNDLRLLHDLLEDREKTLSNKVDKEEYKQFKNGINDALTGLYEGHAAVVDALTDTVNINNIHREYNNGLYDLLGDNINVINSLVENNENILKSNERILNKKSDINNTINDISNILAKEERFDNYDDINGDYNNDEIVKYNLGEGINQVTQAENDNNINSSLINQDETEEYAEYNGDEEENTHAKQYKEPQKGEINEDMQQYYNDLRTKDKSNAARQFQKKYNMSAKEAVARGLIKYKKETKYPGSYSKKKNNPQDK